MNIRFALLLSVALGLAAMAGEPGVLTVEDLDNPLDEPSGVAQPAEAPAPAVAVVPESTFATPPAVAPSRAPAPSPANATTAAGSGGTLARATGSEAVAAPKLPVASANTFAYPVGSQAIRHADRTLQITSPEGVATTYPAGSRAFRLRDGSLNVVVPAVPAPSPAPVAPAAPAALAPAPAARPSGSASLAAPSSAAPQVPRPAASAAITSPERPALQTSVVPAASLDRGGMGSGLETVAADGDRFVEVFFERYKRDVKGSYEFFRTREEDRVFARLNFRRSPEASFTADFGLVDAKDSEEFVPMLGGGVSKEVYSQDDIVLTLFGQASYVFESEVKKTEYWYSPVYRGNVTAEYVTSEAYWEFGGGLRVGKFWRNRDGLRLFTYGGLLVSFLDANGEIRDGKWLRNGRVISDYQDKTSAEEDKPIGIFGGVEWWPAGSPISIRAEMRRISHESFSLGAGMAF